MQIRFGLSITLLMLVNLIVKAINNNVSSLCFPTSDKRLGIHFRNACHPLCSEGFTIHEATVACRELGKATNMVRITRYPTGKDQGVAPMHESRCTGSENRLSQCYMGMLQHCRQGYAGVMCSNDSTVTNVTLDKKRIRVYDGSNVTVTCSAHGRLQHLHYWYQWTLSNGTNDMVLGMVPSVTRQVVKSDNNHNLTCSVFERDKQLSNRSVLLEVYYPPRPFNDTTRYVLRGSDVNLTESEPSNPLPDNYTWEILQSNSTLGLSFKNEKSPPVIHDISKTGVYIVRMSNRMDVTQGIPRTGHGVRIVRINVTDPPKLSCEKHVFVPENSTATLGCVSPRVRSLHPDFININNVRWTKLDVPEGRGDRLNITDAGEKHNGTYTCTVLYKIKDEQSRYEEINCSTTLHILVQPEVTASFEIGANITGRNFTNITDINIYTTWKKLEDGELKDPIAKFPDFTNLGKLHSGAYVGKDEEDKEVMIKLQVLYEPEVTCDPYIVIPIGEQKEITCSIDAFPLVTDITWSLPRGFEVNSSLPGRNKTSYTINNAQWTDAGSYNCTASNTQGSGFCEITVKIISGKQEESYLAIGVVSGVFSTLVLVMLLVILFLAWKLYRDRKGRDRKDSMISLPLKTTVTVPEIESSVTRRPLPKAPGKNDGPQGKKSIEDNSFQQDVYENA